MPPPVALAPHTTGRVGRAIYTAPVARRPTLITVAIANLLAASDDKGIRAQLRATKEAGVVVGFLVTLAITYRQLDRDEFITQLEWAEYGRMDERTAQRYWARFRKAFPHEESPERLARWIASKISDSEPMAAASVLAPADFAAAA
jgi:hypothetical protein